MKPAAFDYEAPTTAAEVVEILDTVEGAKVLAGGQSLIPMLNIRLAQPACLIDLERVGGLDGLTWDGDTLTVGAMTRQRTIEFDPEVARRLPVLADAVRHIGHVAIRNRGTVGGSIAHADPAAELPVAVAALGATLVASGPDGERTIAAADFFRMFLTSDLEHNELLTSIEFPLPPPTAAGAFVELTRKAGDFAVVSVMAVVNVDPASGTIDYARIGIGGVGPVPLRLTAAEEALVGATPSASAIDAAADIAHRDAEPFEDAHGPASYRRHLAHVLTTRALADAFGRAQGAHR